MLHENEAYLKTINYYVEKQLYSEVCIYNGNICYTALNLGLKIHLRVNDVTGHFSVQRP